MIINDSTAQSQPSLTQQAHNTEFADPRFGTPLKRISASTLGLSFSSTGDGLHSEYPQLSAFNGNNSLVLLTAGAGIKGGGYIVDFKNPSQILHTINYQEASSAHDGAALRWDPIIPTRLWFWQTIAWNNFTTTCNTSSGSNVLTNVSVTTGMVGATLHVLGAGPNNSQGNPGMYTGVVQSSTSNTLTMDNNVTFNTTGATFRITSRLCRYDLNTGSIPYTRTITVVRDFTEYFAIENSGSSTTWTGAQGGSASASWEEMSDDGNWIAAYATIDGTMKGYQYVNNTTPGSLTLLDTNSNHTVFAYNVNTNTKIVMNINDAPGSHSSIEGGTLGTAYSPYGTTNAVDSVDWVAMSPSGTYVVVNHNTNNWLQAGGNWDKYGGAVCYTRSTGAFAGKLTGSTGHGDLIKYSGNEYLVIDSSAGTNNPFDSSFLIAYKLPESVTWSGTPYTTAGVDATTSYSNGGVIKLFDHQYANIHVSARNISDPTFLIVECYGNTGLTNFDDECVKVYMDSRVGQSGSSPHYERLFHFRTSAASYYSQGFPSVSKNGEYIVFGSDWGTSSQLMDAYIADIKWFSHFPSAKTWRKGIAQTNFAGGSNGGDRLGSFNGWKSVAWASGTDRTKDGIYGNGFNAKADGTVANFYSNDTWRWDPDKWRFNLVLPSDISTSDGSGNDLSGAYKIARRVQVPGTGTTVTFRDGSPATVSAPAWVPGTDLINIYDYRGTTLKYSNLSLSSVGSSTVVFTTSVTVAKNDMMYKSTDTVGPCANWFSWGTKPCMGHPYHHIRSDTTRNQIICGAKNAGNPIMKTSHTMYYDPPTNVWGWWHVGYWQGGGTISDSSGTTLRGMDNVGGADAAFDLPEASSTSNWEYIAATDEIIALKSGQQEAESFSPPDKTWIFHCSGGSAGTWTTYASTAGSTNPGWCAEAVFQCDSSGTVWCIGGFDGSSNPIAFDHAWKWNSSTHVWSQVTLGGAVPAARGSASYAYNPNTNKLMITGGALVAHSTFLKSSALLDLATLTWEALPDLPFEYNTSNGFTGPFYDDDNFLAYMPLPYDAFAMIDYRVGYGPSSVPGPTVDGVTAQFDPRMIFLQDSGTVVPPVTPGPNNPFTKVVFSQL